MATQPAQTKTPAIEQPDRRAFSRPKTDAEWLSKIDLLWGDHDRTKYFYERQWYLNIAHFLGFQYATWNEHGRRLEEPKVPTYRVRMVSNRILSTILLALAKLTKTKPIMTTLPATTEEEDRNAARTGDKVLEVLWRKLEMDIRLQDVILWSLLAANSYWKIYWNAKTGPKIRYQVDTEGEPIVSEDSDQIPAIGEDGVSPVEKEFNLGEVAVDILSPFEVYVDPQAKEGSKPSWMLHMKVRSLAKIREMYPEKGNLVAAEHDISSSTFFEQKIMSLISTFTFSGVLSSERHEDSALLKEYWHEPNEDYPRGKLVSVANGIILQNTDWPDENLEPDTSLDMGPFVKFTDIPIPGRYWGMSTVENLIPLQKNYNRSRSQVVEARNLMSKPKWLVPRGANIAQSAITSEPGEVVEYTPVLNHKPEQVKAPEIPSYIKDEQNQTIKDMEETSMIHQVSKGEAPQGVRAGIAIRFLQEMDDTAIGPKIRRIENALARAGTLLLRTVQEHYKENRVMQVVGKNRDVEVFDFQGSDLRNNSDVVVQAGSGFPELKSAKQQYLLDLYQQGLFGDVNDSQVRGKVMRLLELGDVDTAFEDERMDERWAEQENRLMAEGQMPEPQYWENHITHKTVLNRYMKTEAYRNLPEDRKNIFKAHDALHSQMLAPEPPPLPPGTEPPSPGSEVSSPSSQESASTNGTQPAPVGGQ